MRFSWNDVILLKFYFTYYTVYLYFFEMKKYCLIFRIYQKIIFCKFKCQREVQYFKNISVNVLDSRIIYFSYLFILRFAIILLVILNAIFSCILTSLELYLFLFLFQAVCCKYKHMSLQ